MNFRLIDYSAVLHKGSLPPVRKGKFLQIVEDGETEILILSPYYGRFSAEGLPGKIRALPEFGRYEIVITLPGTSLQ